MNPYLKNLNRLEFVVTSACTGRCKHCSQGDHPSGGAHIDARAAVNAIRELCGRYALRSLMAFGGEPLLFPETVCAIFRAASAERVPQIDLITNGFFARDPARIDAVAGMLAESGATRVLLSVDAFHQETIPLEPVERFAERVKASGVAIRLNPAWLGGAAHDNPYNARTRALLAEFAALGIPAGAGNAVFPRGNALKYLGEYFAESAAHADPYEENPREVRAVSVSPDGSALGGNILRESILDILERYRP